MADQTSADATRALGHGSAQHQIGTDDQAHFDSSRYYHPGADIHLTSSPPEAAADEWSCWICASSHHFKKQCPHNKHRTPPEDVKCWRCERFGHYGWQCLGCVSSPNEPEWAPLDCMECGGKDHFAARCPVRALPRYSCGYCIIHGRTRGVRQLYIDVVGRTRCKEDQECSRISPP